MQCSGECMLSRQCMHVRECSVRRYMQNATSGSKPVSKPVRRKPCMPGRRRRRRESSTQQAREHARSPGPRILEPQYLRVCGGAWRVSCGCAVPVFGPNEVARGRSGVVAALRCGIRLNPKLVVPPAGAVNLLPVSDHCSRCSSNQIACVGERVHVRVREGSVIIVRRCMWLQRIYVTCMGTYVCIRDIRVYTRIRVYIPYTYTVYITYIYRCICARIRTYVRTYVRV